MHQSRQTKYWLCQPKMPHQSIIFIIVSWGSFINDQVIHLDCFPARLPGSILLGHIDCGALHHLQHTLLHSLTWQNGNQQ